MKILFDLKWNIMSATAIRSLLAVLTVIAISSSILAQQTKRPNKEQRPVYLEIAFGKAISMFRDYATSPLFYEGNPTYFALAHTDFDAKRASTFQLSYAFGQFNAHSFQPETASKVNIVAINYQELYHLPSLSSSKVNFKIGGQFNASAILRENISLGNNSKGFDLIANLFGSTQVTVDLSKSKNNLKSNIALALHAGLINSAYRNGFIYTRQSPLLNQDNINDGYEFRLFSGFRMNTAIDYTIWLRNQNAIRLSYLWDINQTTGGYDTFEMANHLLKLSILFSLNKIK